jgi:tetratricopeptide (TPR) repeat protein
VFNYPRKFLSSTFLVTLVWGLLPLSISAKPLPQQDPLLPPPSLNRPLTEFEVNRIKRKIEEFNLQANNELNADNLDGAFSFWYRELELQRALGWQNEIPALGRIGAVAWSNNRSTDLRNIARRLAIIQPELTTNDSLDLLSRAYEQIRYLDRAIQIREQLLVNATTDKLKILEDLGELYLAKFDYAESARVYEELLGQVDLNKNNLNDDSRIEFYLERLVLVYDKTKQPKLGIPIKQRLIGYYTDIGKTDKLAALNLSIARDYVLLNDFNAADRAYRRSFELAYNLQQFALANDSLKELGELKLNNQQIPEAIAIYQQLITVQKQASDYYSLTNTYDRLGRIYQQTGDLEKAKTAFREGLAVAKSLNYRVDYFTNLLQSIE